MIHMFQLVSAELFNQVFLSCSFVAKGTPSRVERRGFLLLWVLLGFF